MKNKIPFDISYRPQIENGEVQLETKRGDEVSILKWDAKHDTYPIIGIVIRKDYDKEGIASWTIEGINYADYPSDDDLVIVEAENELTEFEDKLGQMMHSTWDIIKDCEECQNDVDDVRVQAKELLELAEKQLEKKFRTEILPKWKKYFYPGAEHDTWLSKRDGDYTLYHNGYKIKVEELEKLPKEDSV